MDSFNKSKIFFKKFRVGNQVAISNKAYAYLYNQFLRNTKLGKVKGYNQKRLENDNKVKKARPIIIIYNSSESDKFIAISQSESNSAIARKQNYINQENKIWKSEVLVLEKKHTILYQKGKIYSKYTKLEIQEYINYLENKHPKIYNYLNERINEIKNNSNKK